MRVSCFCVFLILSAATPVFAQDTNFASGPQYLLTGSPLFARSIATPTLSLQVFPLEVGASNATAGVIAGAENQTVVPQPPAPPDLFSIYYGPPTTSVIEISFGESSSVAEIPASLVDTGVGQTTTAQDLRELGYGDTMGGFAAYEKAHARRATHLYTNADLARLHGGS